MNNLILTWSASTRSLMKWWRVSICFGLAWYVVLCAKSIPLLLSEDSTIDCVEFSFNSSNSIFHLTTSWHAGDIARYSASIFDNSTLRIPCYVVTLIYVRITCCPICIAITNNAIVILSELHFEFYVPKYSLNCSPMNLSRLFVELPNHPHCKGNGLLIISAAYNGLPIASW